MCAKQQICLVMLVGVPGSGKSYFRKFLENYFKTNVDSILGSVQMCNVCFDDYCTVRNPSQLCDCTTWKDERLEILKVVENIILTIGGGKAETFPNTSLVNQDIEDPNYVLLIIDDNMFYRSMRYEYFKLAKTYTLSFCQIFFDITLENALKFNKNRQSDSKVPDTVIKAMFQKIEPPQISHSWEINSIFVSSPADFKDECVLNNIFTCIKGALENPIIQQNTEVMNKNQARQITNSNALHQIDNLLKRLVGVCIKRKIQGSKQDPHVVSRHYSEKRLVLLKQIKEGNLELPIDLTKPVDREKIESLKLVLLDLLEK